MTNQSIQEKDGKQTLKKTIKKGLESGVSDCSLDQIFAGARDRVNTIHNFSVVIERDEDGYFVHCPELSGCHSQGDTYEEALANIQEAIQAYVEDMVASNEEIPQQHPVSVSSVAVTI